MRVHIRMILFGITVFQWEIKGIMGFMYHLIIGYGIGDYKPIAWFVGIWALFFCVGSGLDPLKPIPT